MYIEVKIKQKVVNSTLFKDWRQVYGVVVLTESDVEIFSPDYPFVLSVDDTVLLEEFLEDYSSNIIEYCVSGRKNGFAEYLYRSSTEAKYFKDKMYYKGLYVD